MTYTKIMILPLSLLYFFYFTFAAFDVDYRIVLRYFFAASAALIMLHSFRAAPGYLWGRYFARDGQSIQRNAGKT